jgi:hypothetical protein
MDAVYACIAYSKLEPVGGYSRSSMKDDHTKLADIARDIYKGNEYATALAVKTEQAVAV